MLIKLVDACSCLIALKYAPISIKKKFTTLIAILCILYQKKTEMVYIDSKFVVDKPFSFLILLLYWHEIYVIKKNCKLTNKPIVLDIGANIGQWSRHFNFFFPNANMYSFEPNEKVVNVLSNNAKYIKGWHVFPFGVGPLHRSPLYIPREGSAEGTLIKPKTTKVDTIFVQCLPLTTSTSKKWKIPLLVDLVKIDVEGYEEEILKHTHSVRTKYLEIEVDFSSESKRNVSHVIEWIDTYWNASARVVAIQRAHFLSTIGNAYFEISYERKR